MVRGVDRHVKRREPVFKDSLDVPLFHIRQCREIPVGERQAVVIIADVERFAQTGGESFDEADLAAVGATAHGWGDQGDAERFAIKPLELVDDLFAIRLARFDHQVFVSGQKLPVEEVGNGSSVHRLQLRSGKDPELRCDAVFLYSEYLDHSSSNLEPSRSKSIIHHALARTSSRGARARNSSNWRADRQRFEKLSCAIEVEAWQFRDRFFTGVANPLNATEFLQ